MNTTNDTNNTVIWAKLGLTAFFWAMMFHLGKYAVGYMSPAAIGGWRFLLAGALLVVLMRWRGGLDWAGFARNAWPLLAMAAIGIGGFNLALFYGLRHTSPVNSALIIALTPAITAAFSSVLNRERPSMSQGIGLLLALLGVATVVSHGSLRAFLSLSFTAGDMLVLVACVCWAIYSTIPRRFVKDLAPLQMTTATIVLGGVLMSVFAQSASTDFFTLPPWSVVAAVVAMSVFGSVIAYVWWNDSVGKVGPAKAAIFMNLVPIFAALIGVALGQRLEWAQIAGAALVVSGVVYSSLNPAVQGQALTINKIKPAAAPCR